MNIGDKVKFNFSTNKKLEVRAGVIVDVWQSTVSKNKNRYAVKDDTSGFELYVNEKDLL